ncbi:MAG: N-acetylglucosamine kinase [Gammaproteobacteria bacterium]|nr:N-acetylglucosamine kinase [Gammaproteobacteria bacterium]
MSYLIGVDGGGTSCRVAVADVSGKVLARAHSGPANIATDYSMARENILSAIQTAWHLAGLAQQSMNQANCVLGLAGANVGRYAKQMEASLPFRSCIVTDDRATSLKGALGDEDGCIAVVGTGSFFSSRYDGVATNIGGWGLMLGDDGGGARLGQSLLRRVIHCYDGVHQHSELTRSTLSDFNDSPHKIVEFAMQARPGDFAAFAPAVVDAACDSDNHGLSLVNDTVEEIQLCIDKVGYKATSQLYLLGGLGSTLLEFLDARYVNASNQPKGDALSGAVVMAQQLSAPNRGAGNADR